MVNFSCYNQTICYRVLKNENIPLTNKSQNGSVPSHPPPSSDDKGNVKQVCGFILFFMQVAYI